MKASINFIRAFNERYQTASDPAPHGAQALIETIGAQLAGVDEVTPFGERFNGVLVARVVSCEDHPNADRLHVCKVDDGGVIEHIERDENGYVQVVCGAPNVREGLLVAWLPPGATVPNTLDKDPFVLEVRALRGVVSNGMLASAKELTLGDSHDGILELDTDAAPGTSFARAYHLEDDVIIDMENKMFTHRPDCFGWLGIAREIAGIQQQAFKSPEWYVPQPVFPEIEAEELPLTVDNQLPQLVPRFTAITMRDVTVKTSPVWLQIALTQAGVRPINNIVDYTNFFMLETGQPLHAYDYDKVKALDGGAANATLTVQHPRQGETIALLNGKTIEPRPEAIMIATRDTLIGVGGVMGGTDTEVDEHTTNIIIEAATFDMYSIRRTAMTHGLFTDAVTRFNKGQSPLQNLAVLAKMVNEVQRFADGKVASLVIDSNNLSSTVKESETVHAPCIVQPEFVNTRLGLNLSPADIAQLLRNVEFEVTEQNDGALRIKAPFWRTDIAIAVDIVEEVGRLYGFDKLPLILPQRAIIPTTRNVMFDMQARLRNILASAGANEVLAYSFVHGNLLDKVGQSRDSAFSLSNALSPDLQYFRLSLTPSLLEKIHFNSKAGHNEFALFEIGKGHVVGEMSASEPETPAELERLAFVFAANAKVEGSYSGAAYYQARAYLDYILVQLNLTDSVTIVPLDPTAYDGYTQTKIAYYDSSRAATILIGDRKSVV